MNKHLQRFLNEEVAVRLRTEDEYDKFMNLLEEKTDILWRSGNKPTQRHHWSQHKEEFAVKYRNSTDDEWWTGMSYGDCEWFERTGTQLIEFKDLLKGEEKIMTPAEKLRFLSDRVEDEREFVYYCTEYCFFRGVLHFKDEDKEKWLVSGLSFKGMIGGKGTFKLKPRWAFTDDEKAILRSLRLMYSYIIRDHNKDLIACENKPVKKDGIFMLKGFIGHLKPFNHLFKSVKTADEEACPFREYL